MKGKLISSIKVFLEWQIFLLTKLIHTKYLISVNSHGIYCMLLELIQIINCVYQSFDDISVACSGHIWNEDVAMNTD